MERRNGWLFPLMVVAAGSVTALSSIGIAAILGYLPGLRGSLEPAAYQTGSGSHGASDAPPAGLVAQANMVDIVVQPIPGKEIKPPATQATTH